MNTAIIHQYHNFVSLNIKGKIVKAIIACLLGKLKVSSEIKAKPGLSLATKIFNIVATKKLQTRDSHKNINLFLLRNRIIVGITKNSIALVIQWSNNIIALFKKPKFKEKINSSIWLSKKKLIIKSAILTAVIKYNLFILLLTKFYLYNLWKPLLCLKLNNN